MNRIKAFAYIIGLTIALTVYLLLFGFSNDIAIYMISMYVMTTFAIILSMLGIIRTQ